jgi:hypothetical protein
MKKNVLSKLLMLVVLSAFLMSSGCEYKKVRILHNGKVIQVSVNAYDAHKDHHGDCYLGPVWD